MCGEKEWGEENIKIKTSHKASTIPDNRRVVFVGTAHDSWRNNCKAERERLEYILPLDSQMKDAIHKNSANVN